MKTLMERKDSGAALVSVLGDQRENNLLSGEASRLFLGSEETVKEDHWEACGQYKLPPTTNEVLYNGKNETARHSFPLRRLLVGRGKVLK